MIFSVGMVFLKEFFEKKINFEKTTTADNKKSMKNYPEYVMIYINMKQPARLAQYLVVHPSQSFDASTSSKHCFIHEQTSLQEPTYVAVLIALIILLVVLFLL